MRRQAGKKAMTPAIQELRLLLSAAAIALAACSPGQTADEPVKVSSEAPAAGQVPDSPQANVIPPQSSLPAQQPLPVLTDMSPTDSMPACRRGLIGKGLNEAELEIMLGPMAGVCPNNGVSEGRIREILTTIWTQAGCHQHSPIEVAKALDSGACGGDAG
jgi:hypothetical protein